MAEDGEKVKTASEEESDETGLAFHGIVSLTQSDLEGEGPGLYSNALMLHRNFLSNLRSTKVCMNQGRIIYHR